MQATLRPFNPITGRADVQLDECTSAPDANTRLWDYAENWCRKVRAEETLIVDEIFSPQKLPAVPHCADGWRL
jgi:hypothetical protein